MMIVFLENIINLSFECKCPHGILAILDEECQRPGLVTDDTFLSKLVQELGDNPHFDKEKSRSSDTLATDFRYLFIIHICA